MFHLLPYVEQAAVWKQANSNGTIEPLWDTPSPSAPTGYLKGTRLSVYRCPSDPSLGNALDWGDGDASYAGNFLAFGSRSDPANWDGKARMPASFQDGTSNTIGFAEKYARCDGTGVPGGNWWLRGIYNGYGGTTPPIGTNDSYPGDRLSVVFGGGRGNDGTSWATVGNTATFQTAPRDFLKNPGPCQKELASTAHNTMNVCMIDGSVRGVSPSVTAATWWNAVHPADGNPLGSDW